MSNTLAKVHSDVELGDIIGYIKGQPVFLIGGAGEDDDTDDNDEGGEEDDEDEDDGDQDVTLKKRELDAIKKHKNQAQKEAKERRLLLEKYGIDPKTGKKADEDEDDEDDDKPSKKKSSALDKKALTKAVAAATAAERARWKPIAIKGATSAAFDKEGWKGETADLARDLIDLDELDLDDEGNVIGLDDQISELKRKYPAMFKKKKATASTGGTSGAGAVDGGDKKTKTGGEKSWVERLSAQADR